MCYPQHAELQSAAARAAGNVRVCVGGGKGRGWMGRQNPPDTTQPHLGPLYLINEMKFHSEQLP